MTVAVGCCVACGKVLAENKHGGGFQEAAHAKVLVRSGENALWKQMCIVKHEGGGACLNPGCLQRLRRQGKTVLRRSYVGIDPTPERQRPAEPKDQTHLRLIKGVSKKKQRRIARRRVELAPV